MWRTFPQSAWSYLWRLHSGQEPGTLLQYEDWHTQSDSFLTEVTRVFIEVDLARLKQRSKPTQLKNRDSWKQRCTYSYFNNAMNVQTVTETAVHCISRVIWRTSVSSVFLLESCHGSEVIIKGLNSARVTTHKMREVFILIVSSITGLHRWCNHMKYSSDFAPVVFQIIFRQ